MIQLIFSPMLRNRAKFDLLALKGSMSVTSLVLVVFAQNHTSKNHRLIYRGIARNNKIKRYVFLSSMDFCVKNSAVAITALTNLSMLIWKKERRISQAN